MEIGGEERPGIVHRLDKDTSGLLVCAKTDAALRALQRSFQERTVEKRYRAWCLGRPKERAFELVTGHARHPRDRKRFTTRLPAPAHGIEGPVRRAAAHYTVIISAGGVSEIEVRLETGRTHQIRAQLSDLGHPLLQDALYGGDRAERRIDDVNTRTVVARLTRQALHAERLAFPHPKSGEVMRFVAPLPPDLLPLHALLRPDDEEDGEEHG
jgi:23S rRNA pseudouridine1911/1915/1917 synthase